MNQRNVEALYGLIQAALRDIQMGSTLAGEEAVRRGLAERLAASGVLVPSALTDDQMTDWPFDGEFLAISDADVARRAAHHRRALDSIAKGEETQQEL